MHDVRVQLPDPVKRMIEERAEGAGFAAVKQAADAMSEAYREGRAAALSRLPAAARAAAYLVTRMPATYSAAYSVLRETRARLLDIPVYSILDVGAGTGAASLAARQWFPEARLAMLERDSTFADAARAVLPDAKVLSVDATALEDFPMCDLVIAAYSLGELQQPIAERLWRAARIALIVIEPGTPGGFAFVRSIRDGLLAGGAHMLAPCPMEAECPVRDPDWCHFAARVERSSLHRRIKEAQLNYEDEKFSYVALARAEFPLPGARIVRHPQHSPGLIVLEECTDTGLVTDRVTKRNKEAFRVAHRASWGDALPSGEIGL
jgi:ribosomal protein RSM22 (predicted rRNA methylase)